MLDPVDQRRVILETAAVAPADIRTVRRVLAGEPVRGHVGDRVRRALADRGVQLPDPRVSQQARRA
jgi:hypothetical protein